LGAGHTCGPRSHVQSPAAALGTQVYENTCAVCQQLTGLELPGVFPPLKDSAVTYGSAVPAFADQLTDEEMAAVLTHERTSWGHQAKPVKLEDVVAQG
jgi:mono/diheme cytochrome c family protein